MLPAFYRKWHFFLLQTALSRNNKSVIVCKLVYELETKVKHCTIYRLRPPTLFFPLRGCFLTEQPVQEPEQETRYRGITKA